MEQKSQKLILGTVGVAGLFLAGGATVSANTTHKVVENDTVWGLSQKYGVSVKSIEELNHVDSNSHLIFTGHTIDIPDKATKSVAKPATKAAPKEKAQTATSTYEVKAGDSLWSIAQAHNTTVDRLRSLNSLGSGVIVPGQTLKVDGSATKTAQPNKAAQPAAKNAQAPKQQEASTTTEEAQKATPVTPAKGSTPSVQPQQDKKSNKDVQPQQTKQVVEQPQATQERSAKESAAPVKEAEKPAVQAEKDNEQNEQNAPQTKAEPVQKEDVQNDEQPEQKEAAQPKVSANHKTHSVKSGESLFTVAADYGVSVDSIRQANSLSSSALQVGQSLTINDPTKDPSAAAKPVQASSNSTAKQNVQPAAQKQPSTPAPSQTSNNSSNNNNASQNNASATTTNTSNTTQKPQQEANNANNSSNNNAAQTTPAASNTNATHGHATNTAGNTYAWGQCTWFAKDRASWAGNYWGNGGQWDASARAQGFSVDNQPSAGSLVVFHPGQSVGGQWTADGSYGHVAYVESVSGNSITISQGGMGFSSPSGPNYQTITNASQYTYIHP
ncbi:MAG TPA: LysM peptidoglycan-binding domain-containing protein [Candidatus Ligilactobacillus excrementavium]|nr:LysM peptidoglycan-binding domain-containing protein [Candidatus Ligilactobacillus excrementavium]